MPAPALEARRGLPGVKLGPLKVYCSSTSISTASNHPFCSHQIQQVLASSMPLCGLQQDSRLASLRCMPTSVLTCVKLSMGARPLFSARAKGMKSSASAKARIAYCCTPATCTPAALLSAGPTQVF